MNISRPFFTTVLACFFISAFAAQPRYDKIRIHLDVTHTILQLAAMGFEVDHGDIRKGISVTSDFSEQEIQKLRNAGFTYDVLISDVSTYYANQNNTTKSNSSRSLNCGTTQPFSVPTPANFTTGTMGGFYKYQEMLDVLDSMRARFPNLISARQVIDTFHSIQGRPIYWLRMSNHPDSAQAGKPQILYTALHHAREPAGLTDMVFYMWYLMEHYQTDPTVTALLDNTEMYIVPCVNPDGYIYNQTTNPNGGGMWRKNRRLNSDNTYGVDLNRNYGYNWGLDNVGSSNVTTDETYRGTAGFSEPEIQATKWFAEHHDFRIAVNYHTYGNLLVYPWGYIASFLTPDSVLFEAYAARMTKTNDFVYGTGDQTVGYITNGDSDDWMYGDQTTKNKIFSMTPESGDNSFGFWPPANQIINVCNQNFDLIYSAHKFLLKYVAIKDVSSQVVLNHQFWFKYDAQRLGLDSPGTYN
ncbi:MAG: Carboxypeptidase, partial [Bacteroidota bacterium]|nr:Carboxypeptidase [Bacteroidota bacterium]